MPSGVIIALDLGVRMGVAIGFAGDAPRYMTAVKLKSPGEDASVAFTNLIAFLDGRIRKDRPALVFKEAMLNLRAFKNLGSAAATVTLTAGLHAIVEGMCGRYGVLWQERADSTIRKHFLSIGRLGDRKSTKAAVIGRAHALGLMPRTSRDEDIADAIAAYDFASANLMRKPLPIALFSGRAAA